MKTTIDIQDALLERAKRHAARVRRPLRAIVEEGLRRVLSERSASGAYTLPDASVGDPDAADPLEALSWQDLRQEIFWRAAMIAVDTNILVHAHRRESRHHDPAVEVMRTLAEGRNRWGIPWPCLYEFFSVTTNRRIWKDVASEPDQAWRQIDAWTASPSVSLLAETDDFLAVLERFARRPRVRGPIVHDARVAAICVAHGVEELLTVDRDFGLFPELATRNPLSTTPV